MKHTKYLSLLLAAAIALFAAGGSLAAEETVTRIQLSDTAVTVDGAAASTDPAADVYVGADIVYYEEGTDASYGEGETSDMHTAAEAAAHTVVTITQPGTYRLSGTLSQGQIAVDLGDGAKNDPDAVVTIVLDNVDVTCTVAPAFLVYNAYECDRDYVAYDKGELEDYQPTWEVDTAAAGVNIVIAAGSVNTFTGSHVARIYKEGTTKKLHKYDGAFYSKRSMNIGGDDGDDSGVLNIIGDNEGLDTELHLTINGGTVNIQSQDDGINVNEDHISVVTLNGGNLTITAGLGSEGDGIDSNGYLVINGGTLFSTANARADGGIDAEEPIRINGGAVSAFGGRNDGASSASTQPYMELSFAQSLRVGSVMELKDEAGSTLWSATVTRACSSVTLTNADLQLDTTYHLYVDGVQQAWSGNAFGMMGGHGGMGGGMPGGQRPDRTEDMGQPDAVSGATPTQPDGQQPPQMPEDDQQPPQMPEDGQQPPQMPDGQLFQKGGQPFAGGREGTMDGRLNGQQLQDLDPSRLQGRQSQDGLDRGQLQGKDGQLQGKDGQLQGKDDLGGLKGGFGGQIGDLTQTAGTASPDFVLTATTKSFSGIRAYDADALPFADVETTDPSYTAIQDLYRAGAMTGTGANTFSPNMTLTRAQAITVLARLAGAESAETDAFSDVEPGSWYAGYVGWAVERGIVQGDGQGHFYPDMTVTADQMALMLSRYQAGYQDTCGFSGDLTRAQLAQMAAAVLPE